MSYQAVLTKLLDGIMGADVRAKIAEAINYIVLAYIEGRIDDDQLKSDLTRFSLDVLATKRPTEDIEILKPEAEQWAEQLYRGIKIYALRYRMAKAYGRGE
ncbi:MAG: hypothetical protein RXO54_06985 [Acidilobus sp.]